MLVGNCVLAGLHFQQCHEAWCYIGATFSVISKSLVATMHLILFYLMAIYS